MAAICRLQTLAKSLYSGGKSALITASNGIAAPTLKSFEVKYLTSSPIHRKKSETKYESLPQPDLKPIGPEDYHRWRYYLNRPKIKVPVKEETQEDVDITNAIISKVNEQIESKSHGRLFAVVQVAGKQFKVTTEDIIVVLGLFPPTSGDVIRLEKVMLVGSTDFTLVGRPLLNKDLVRIEATVIEKTLSQVMTRFKFKRRKRYRRTFFYREPFTMLRINSIEFKHKVNETLELEGAEDRILV